MSVSRVLVFVDEANVLGAARALNRRVDWSALRDHLTSVSDGRTLIEMVVYVGLPPIGNEWSYQREKKQRFLHYLRTEGFLVVTKDGSPCDEDRYRANVDVLMALDALEFAVEARPDVVVLATGDSDFAHLAHKLRRRGIRVEVATISQSLASGLRAACNSVIDLREVFNTFEPLYNDFGQSEEGEAE